MKSLTEKKIIIGLFLTLTFLNINAQQIKIQLPQKEKTSQDMMLLGKKPSINMGENINSNVDKEEQISKIKKIADNADERENTEDKAKFITEDMDWKLAYDSGYSKGVIAAWIKLQICELKNILRFRDDFVKIGNRINDPAQYKDFAAKTVYYLLQYKLDSFINIIAEDVRASGKINDYTGILINYMKGAPGTQAPDLVIKNNNTESVMKSKEFARENNAKTILLFYSSGCGPCKDLLQKMPNYYESIKDKEGRIISISADQDVNIFKDKAKDFLWKDILCDYEGFKGLNFQNYGVSGTPTIFLLDNDGKILLRTASLEEILGYLKIT